MTRWLPYPLLSLALLALWLLLNQSLTVGQILLGTLLALAGPLVLTALELPKARLRRVGAMFRLLSLVLVDIVRSNIAVARIILGANFTKEKSGFVKIPLELRDPYGLAVLACIITATPGTLWVNFDSDEGVLMIHVLDLIDERAWIEIVKHRYENLLLEIFA